jgi:hypothetical protein
MNIKDGLAGNECKLTKINVLSYFYLKIDPTVGTLLNQPFTFSAYLSERNVRNSCTYPEMCLVPPETQSSMSSIPICPDFNLLFKTPNFAHPDLDPAVKKIISEHRTSLGINIEASLSNFRSIGRFHRSNHFYFFSPPV